MKALFSLVKKFGEQFSGEQRKALGKLTGLKMHRQIVPLHHKTPAAVNRQGAIYRADKAVKKAFETPAKPTRTAGVNTRMSVGTSRPVDQRSVVTVQKATKPPAGERLPPAPSAATIRKQDLADAQRLARAGQHDRARKLFEKHGVQYDDPRSRKSQATRKLEDKLDLEHDKMSPVEREKTRIALGIAQKVDRAADFGHRQAMTNYSAGAFNHNTYGPTVGHYEVGRAGTASSYINFGTMDEAEAYVKAYEARRKQLTAIQNDAIEKRQLAKLVSKASPLATRAENASKAVQQLNWKSDGPMAVVNAHDAAAKAHRAAAEAIGKLPNGEWRPEAFPHFRKASAHAQESERLMNAATTHGTAAQRAAAKRR